MQSALQHLIASGSNHLTEDDPVMAVKNDSAWQTGIRCDLMRMLTEKNGFLAFDDALHVFPAGRVQLGYDIFDWNDIRLWRYAYDDFNSSSICFAQDAFGEQFCLLENLIYRFNPETGESIRCASSLEEWANMLLDDPSESGHTVASQWSINHTPLGVHTRFLPGIPFVLGGAYDLNNLKAIESVQAMLYRSEIARQIRHIPDRASVHLHI